MAKDLRAWSSTLAVLCVLTAACSSAASAPTPPSASLGAQVNRALPSSIRQLPLTNQHDQTVTLGSWPGKTVLLVPFLTLCSDICPMTTGNLLQVEHTLTVDDAASRVQIVELSVDPGRDSPARLAAYAKLTGATWQLVTETPTELNEIAQFFGISYQVVAEDNPPDIDWWTGKPLTYDINHSDGFIVLDPNGNERFATTAAPNFRGSLNPTLKKFLSDEGEEHLAHPPSPNYTPDDILQVLGWAIHRSLPSQSG